MKARMKAQDHSNVVNMHKPGNKPGIVKTMMTPPLLRGNATIVPATQPDTRTK